MANNHSETLKEICKQIGDALALEIDRANPDEIMGKLGTLTTLLPTSSHAVALSNMLYSEKFMQLTEDNQYRTLSATDKKMIFAGKAKSEGYYVDLANRLNSSLVHGIDALRSTLSFLKQEMSNLPSR